MFIQSYLSKNDIEQRRWYTSGQEIGNRWVWTSTGGVFGFEQGFLPTIATDQGTVLVYAYSCKSNVLFVSNYLFFDAKEILKFISWRMGLGQRLGQRRVSIYMQNSNQRLVQDHK